MDHWGRLRKAIDDRGLSALIADSGEQAARNMASELQDGPSLDNFDPLMGAHNAIMGNALRLAADVAGTEGFIEMMQGDNCPICFLNAKHDEFCDEQECTFSYDPWIDFAADEVVGVWRNLNA